MAKSTQGARTSETEISVDLDAADDKAVRRTAAAEVREGRDATRARTYSPGEREMFKRLDRRQRNVERQYDQKLAAQQAEHQREMAALREEMKRTGVDRDGNDAADVAHDAVIQGFKDKIEAAMEKGDSKAVAELTAQMSRADAQFWAKKAAAAGQTQRADTTAAARTDTAAQTAESRRGKGPTVAGSAFINANADWWEDPEFEAENSYANVIFLRLVNQEGFDPKDRETYNEVAAQLNKRFPDLDAKGASRRQAREAVDDLEDGDGGREGDRETVARADDDIRERDGEAARGDRRDRRSAANQNLQDRGASTNRNRGGVRVLSAAERKTMQDCRLDPDNDRDVTQFLREAAALDAAGA